MDLLLERASDITSQADQRNKERVEQQSAEVSEEWATLVSGLESRRDALTNLSQVWETFEGRWQHFENLLGAIEEKVKRVDGVARSRSHAVETKNNLEVSRGSVSRSV